MNETRKSGRWWFSGHDPSGPNAGAHPEKDDGPRHKANPQTAAAQDAQPSGIDGGLPSISLPKGGGAIRGIDEKLSVDQPSGTGRMEIPVPTSPGRHGFGPTLAASYNSGQGNGAYGLGWGVALPSITRKTSTGLPRYADGADSDVLILAGAEDLVPMLENVDGEWQPQRLTVTVGADQFTVRRYRPRIEGAFLRIERWENAATLEVHWRTVAKDNTTSLFGSTAASRIADPSDPTRVFSWLLDLSFDDRGNAISYEYKPEDTANIPPSAHELGRVLTGNRYPKRVWYGNRTPYVAGGGLPTDWCFEVVFDYGEHAATAPQSAEVQTWPCRPDPFSTYRAGFEVRTLRTCQRILMFHLFPEELGHDAVIVRSTDFGYAPPADPDPALPRYTLLRSVTQTGWIQPPGDTPPETAQLPPLQLDYSTLTIDDTVRTADPESLENLVSDFDGRHRRWVDLFGEGLQGILTEDDDAWYYKQNLSPLSSGQPSGARFGPLQPLAEKPRLTASDTELQLTNLNGDGRLCAVNFRAPMAGWFELDADNSWEPLRTFATANVDWQDPNLRFVDLDGDGLADVLITEDDVLTWYQWKVGAGFGEVQRVPKSADEDRGPALVFSDGAGSIFLADMSGDGLADLVRIRSGETSYWPNLGYGRYGAKLVMDGAPVFENPDLFDERRLRLADIDGSGTADLVYLGSDTTTIWFNQSGNGWTTGRTLRLPAVDDVAQVSVFDLLGTGTASIVWTSPLAGDADQPLHYIDLTASAKPYLLTSVTNNLGATTTLTYAPSTRFYLQDQAAGNPWITRLAFPVHVVERVQIDEAISGTTIVSTYTYHHGFYDPAEREFRGFARVDQLDAESLPAPSGIETFTGTPPTSNDAFTLPPVETRTWYHTGAYVGRIDVAQRLAQEFYRGDAHAPHLGDTALPPTASAEELREACRALRGKVLRQEVYGQDGSPASAHPYTATEHRYEVDLLQPPAGGSYGVFYAWELENVTCHYERDPTDPRVSHEFTLAVDAYANITRSASVGYPRRAPAFDEQGATLVLYHEADYTNISDQSDFYRVGLVVETRDYELTGVTATGAGGLFDHDTLRDAASAAAVISYEEVATGTTPQRRLLKRTRTIYRENDLSAALELGQVESLALVDRSYQLVYTPGLLSETFVASGKITSVDLATQLSGPGAFVDLDGDGNQWAPSHRALYSTDPSHPDPTFAAQHFYLPQGAVDPWGNMAAVVYDAHDLLVTQTTDAVENVTSAEHNYRVLQPWLSTDPNLNRNGVRFDALGMVVATAAMGKQQAGNVDEGDHLDTSTAESSNDDDPTTRLDYDLAAFQAWAANPSHDPDHPAPAWVHTRARVRHRDTSTPWLESYIYSDGLGRIALTKAQAEPGDAPQRGATGELMRDTSGALVFASTDSRWVGSGRVVYDNKGNAVKSYEPFFDSSPTYDEETDLVQWGVTSITRYDPLSRPVRVDNPNGTFRTVQFDPWSTLGYDENDTVLGSEWYARRANGGLGADEADAAQKAAAHDNTPSVTDLDVLGRAFHSVADNGAVGRYETTWTLNIDGLALETTDALGRAVLTQDYDMAGGELQHSSVDSGERWMLYDAKGQHVLAWDSREHQIRCVYDALRRPAALSVSASGGGERVAEQVRYGESLADAQAHNLRGVAYLHADQAGIAATGSRDFNGNVLSTSRQLLDDYFGDVDWSTTAPLSDETFVTTTAYDALNRVTTVTTPDSSITTNGYNERSLLATVSVNLLGAGTASPIVTSVAYDAKGQRLTIAYGNQATGNYAYDSETFRLRTLTTTRAASGGPLQALSYTYDPVGNITRLADAAQQTIFYNGQVVTPNTDYTYDAIYRLTRASGREQIGQAGQPQTTWSDAARTMIPLPVDAEAMRNYVETYGYDAVGNLKSLAHTAAQGNWTRNYTSDPGSNRLSAATVVGITNPTTDSYTYDAHGNTASMRHLSIMNWDWKDQLAATAQQVVNSGTPETTYYRYDAGGERVLKATKKNSGTLAVQRLYLGGYEVYREYASDGAVTLERETLDLGGGTTRVCLIETLTVSASVAAMANQAPLLRYQMANHLGSAVLELDPDAAIISYEEYYPHGSTSFQSGRSAAEVGLKRYRYTEKERDGESGFAYHGARYYAAWLGRWISPDPSGMPDGVNRYAYARGNPVSGRDPTGLATQNVDVGGAILYADKIKGVEKLGQAVQKDHPISQKIIEDILGPGRRLYKKGRDLTIAVETGAASEESPALWHTLKSTREKSVQKAVEALVDARKSISMSADVVEPMVKVLTEVSGTTKLSRQQYVAMLSQLGNIHATTTLEEAGKLAHLFSSGKVGTFTARIRQLSQQKTGVAAWTRVLRTIAKNENVAAVAAKAAPAAAGLGKAVHGLGRVLGPAALAGEAVRFATAKNTVDRADAGIGAVSSALTMSRNPYALALGTGLMAGQELDHRLSVSDYSSQAGVFVSEKLTSMGVSATAAYAVGGLASFLAIPGAAVYGLGGALSRFE